MEQPPRFFSLARSLTPAFINNKTTFPFVHYYSKFLSPTSILECNSHKIKIHIYWTFWISLFVVISGQNLTLVFSLFGCRYHIWLFEAWMFTSTVVSFVVRNIIFRKAPPSVVSGYEKQSINLNKVVATFEKHIFLSQTDLTRTGIISNCYNEMFEA